MPRPKPTALAHWLTWGVLTATGLAAVSLTASTVGDWRFELLAEPEPSGFAVPAESERPKVFIAAAGASGDARDQADHVAEGANDQVTLQSAIEALPEAGGAILLSGGIFEISAPIEIPSNVKLIGAGRDRTLLRLDPGKVSLGLHTGVVRMYGADSEIRNLSIDASNPDNRKVEDASNRSSGVYLDIGSENVLLENIAVRNTTRHGVAVLGKGHTLRNLRAEKAASGYCVSIGDGSRARPGAWDIRIEDLFVRDSGGRGGIEINDGIDGVVIDGFYSGGHGNHTRGAIHIREHGRESEYVRNVTLRDGVIDLSDATVDYRRPSRRGVVMASDQNRIENIVLNSIEFRSVNETGVLLRGNIHGVRLNGLDFTGVDKAPIRIESVGDNTPQDVTLDGQPYRSGD